MGDPSRYPEIRLARHMYALQWLPRDIRDDRPLLQQCLVIKTPRARGGSRWRLASFGWRGGGGGALPLPF
eukprot:scaffold15022_cov117-Isochrysis_galbana.AAC.13